LEAPHLPDFIYQYADRLRDADAMFSFGAQQDQNGRIVMYLGNKGIVYFELECSGEHWRKGPTQFDIHSSNKAWVDSPVWRMIHALKTMTSDDGNKILIEGFYDNVAPPSEEDLELIKKLEKTFDERPRKELMKVKTFMMMFMAGKPSSSYFTPQPLISMEFGEDTRGLEQKPFCHIR